MLLELHARSFRNLEPLSWCPGPGTHLLLGDNGAGKTSLLEAVYVLVTTRSFRATQLADCCRHGSGTFRLAGEVEGQARVRLEVGWGQGGRHRAVNGSSGTLAEHLAAQPVVVWTAADADALTGAPQLRRRLLDRGIVGLRPTALEALGRYRRALAQKRQLLAAERWGGPEQGSWNRVLAEAAAEVMSLRRLYAERLARAVGEVLETSDLSLPPVEIAYRPSPASGLEGVEALEESLGRMAVKERRRGIPLAGPHRDDLEVRWGGKPLGAVASAGERKALGLVVTLAHGRVLEQAGRRPLYLLDDVDTELSATTLRAVWRALAGVGQLVATSNRAAVWEGIDAAEHWWIEAGRVRCPPSGG